MFPSNEALLQVRLSDLETQRQVVFKDKVGGILTTAHPATLSDGSIVNFTSDVSLCPSRVANLWLLLVLPQRRLIGNLLHANVDTIALVHSPAVKASEQVGERTGRTFIVFGCTDRRQVYRVPHPAWQLAA